ncbi:LOC402855 protein [Streptomyces azureus]|uniref:LOC402855 protein n=1 Tax=Streptomyces azureus TaxID=146537 RepID=A0A0K8PEI3_STRAJ|nr:LOC402855 protein [Streptomyces azureus]
MAPGDELEDVLLAVGQDENPRLGAGPGQLPGGLEPLVGLILATDRRMSPRPQQQGVGRDEHEGVQPEDPPEQGRRVPPPRHRRDPACAPSGRAAIRATTHPRPNIRLTAGRSWGAATGKDEDWA